MAPSPRDGLLLCRLSLPAIHPVRANRLPRCRGRRPLINVRRIAQQIEEERRKSEEFRAKKESDIARARAAAEVSNAWLVHKGIFLHYLVEPPICAMAPSALCRRGRVCMTGACTTHSFS